MKNTFYITTPIYYPNAKPHIGSLYSTVIADIFARFYKLLGKDVLFLTGLDQHGQKVAEAAARENMDCQSFVNSITKIYKDVFQKWHINYDIFIETSASYHTTSVQKWIIELQAKGYIYKDTYQGWYSISQENFLTEKDIELVNEKGTPLCPITKQEAVWISQEAYFFRLSSFSQKLLDFFHDNPRFIVQEERIEEVISFINQGLRDLCISRLKKDLSWGISFPGDDDHVIYVWADALNNYITGIGYLQNDRTDLFEKFWPCDLHVMAKDIIRFHTIYWLSFLMASDLPLPKKEFVHGWLLVNNQKMSKSLGNVIDPEAILNEYDPDVIRYYFSTLSNKDDVSFSFAELDQKYISDLCDNISNLLQRTNALCIKNNITTIICNPNNYQTNLEKDLFNMLKEIQNNIIQAIFDYQLLKINQLIMQASSALNAYFHAKHPWKITDSNELEKVLGIVLYGLYHIAIWAGPVMPFKMTELKKLLGVGNQINVDAFDFLEKNPIITFNIKKIDHYLFAKKIITVTKNEHNTNEHNTEAHREKIKITEQQTTSINFDEFTKNIILVGQIIAIEDIPKSNKLYYLTVNFGDSYGTKKIASGIKNYYTKEELLHKKSLFCYNLEPRKLCGVTSEGMILMTQDSVGKPHMVDIAENISLGTRLG